MIDEIILLFESTIYENNFSVSQTKELHEITLKMSDISIQTKTKNPKKILSLLRQFDSLQEIYIKKYESFQGDEALLNKKLRDYENSKAPLLKVFRSQLKRCIK